MSVLKSWRIFINDIPEGNAKSKRTINLIFIFGQKWVIYYI
jgi:hypothetical protein